MTPRIPVPGPDDVRRDAAELLALTAPPGGDPPATMAVLAHRPELLGPFLTWAAALALEGTLPKRDHELVALRVAWNCRSAFEWREHSEFARAAGITDAEIARVAGAVDADWAPHEAALLRAADELHGSSTVSDPTWSTLAAHYDTGPLVEVLFVAGQYTMLSMVANAAGIDPPRMYHLALRLEWEAARDDGSYRRSTLGASLEDVGFIHCSHAHQVQTIADTVYRGRDDVVLLEIDPARLDAEVRVEPVHGDEYPHIYGPLPVDAVVRTHDLDGWLRSRASRRG